MKRWQFIGFFFVFVFVSLILISNSSGIIFIECNTVSTELCPYTNCTGECGLYGRCLCPNQQGVCEGSYKTCTDGVWTDCDYTPISGYEANEVTCDSLDNDCDGSTDEGFDPDTCEGTCLNPPYSGDAFGAWLFDDPGNSQAIVSDCCGDDANEYFFDFDDIIRDACCQHLSDCVGFSPLGACYQSDLPSTSTGIDDAWLCYENEWFECTSGLSCWSGGSHWKCTTSDGSSWGWFYTANIPSEICDGFDNDCDGSIDEGCPCSPEGGTKSCGVNNIGECQKGTQECEGGIWKDCVGAILPTTEICGDDLDNDCDGVIDEGCPCTPEETRSCGIDTGECQEGIQICSSDGYWGGVCVDAILPTTEICDGSDNNCDGSTDEGFDPNTCSNACEALGKYFITQSCLGERTACCPNADDKVSATGTCIDSCCQLGSIVISPDCGTDIICETNESIEITAQIAGDCSFIDYIQVDAQNTDCIIENSGGDIVGIGSIIAVNPVDTLISISWTIPTIPTACFDDIIHGTAAALYSGGAPETGTWVTGTTSISGSFNFISTGGYCGDGIKQVGEDCYNCPNDAGCTGDEICYISEENGECKIYDGTPAGSCNDDEICELGESCDCYEDCEGEQDSCIIGRICNTLADNGGFTYECVCDNLDDGFCPLECPDDPDCIGECGNSISEGSELCELHEGEWSGCNPGETCSGLNTYLTGNPCDCYSELENGWILYYTRGNCIPTKGKEGEQDTTLIARCTWSAGCDGTSYEDYTIESGIENEEKVLDTRKEKCTLPPEKIPFFTNLNILLVIVILIGYYLKKKD